MVNNKLNIEQFSENFIFEKLNIKDSYTISHIKENLFNLKKVHLDTYINTICYFKKDKCVMICERNRYFYLPDSLYDRYVYHYSPLKEILIHHYNLSNDIYIYHTVDSYLRRIEEVYFEQNKSNIIKKCFDILNKQNSLYNNLFK